MRQFALWCALVLLSCSRAVAGPPFQTDDPEPVPFHHYEAYAFGTLDHAGGDTFAQVPAFEFNIGAAPNLQLHIVTPFAYLSREGAFGAGDIELGAKYRFVEETARRPQIGTFPMLEVASGDSRRGLGNGSTWAKIPVWVQKSHGAWTTYGGVGYQINRAPGMKDSRFAGWLLQRRLTKRLILGSEVFAQSAQEIGGRESTFVDVGGFYNFTPNLSLLFMSGHTAAGESHLVGYLGLYYTWGRDRSAPPSPAPGLHLRGVLAKLLHVTTHEVS
jgi:hypothetical protein